MRYKWNDQRSERTWRVYVCAKSNKKREEEKKIDSSKNKKMNESHSFKTQLHSPSLGNDRRSIIYVFVLYYFHN